jgi:hypothetical protein
LRFLTRITSSNELIDLRFVYDKLGRLLSASDELQQTSFQRNLDPFGNILCEQFSTGLELWKEYDAFDRPIRLILPVNARSITTTTPIFAMHQKTSASGKTRHHTYEEYDQWQPDQQQSPTQTTYFTMIH